MIVTLLPQATRTGRTVQEVNVPGQVARVASVFIWVKSATYTDPATGIDLALRWRVGQADPWHDLAAIAGSRGGPDLTHPDGTPLLAPDGQPFRAGVFVPLGEVERDMRRIEYTLDVIGAVNFALLGDITPV